MDEKDQSYFGFIFQELALNTSDDFNQKLLTSLGLKAIPLFAFCTSYFNIPFQTILDQKKQMKSSKVYLE